MKPLFSAVFFICVLIGSSQCGPGTEGDEFSGSSDQNEIGHKYKIVLNQVRLSQNGCPNGQPACWATLKIDTGAISKRINGLLENGKSYNFDTEISDSYEYNYAFSINTEPALHIGLPGYPVYDTSVCEKIRTSELLKGPVTVDCPTHDDQSVSVTYSLSTVYSEAEKSDPVFDVYVEYTMSSLGRDICGNDCDSYVELKLGDDNPIDNNLEKSNPNNSSGAVYIMHENFSKLMGNLWDIKLKDWDKTILNRDDTVGELNRLSLKQWFADQDNHNPRPEDLQGARVNLSLKKDSQFTGYLTMTFNRRSQ